MAMMPHLIPCSTVIRNGYTSLTALHTPICYPYGDFLSNKVRS